MPVIDDFEWNLPIPALDPHEPPSPLIEKFLTDDIVQFSTISSADVVIDDIAKIAFVRWKDNKMVTVISSKYVLNPTAKTKQYIKGKKGQVDIEQPQCIKRYN